MRIMLKWINIFALSAFCQYTLAMDWVQIFDSNLNDNPYPNGVNQYRIGDVFLNNPSESLRSPLANAPAYDLRWGVVEGQNVNAIQPINFFNLRNNQTTNIFTQNNSFEQWHSAVTNTLPTQMAIEGKSHSSLTWLELQSFSMGLGSFKYAGTDNPVNPEKENLLDIKQLSIQTVNLPDPPAAAWSFLTAILAYLGLQRLKVRKKEDDEE